MMAFDLVPALPETLLALYAMAVLIGAVYSGKDLLTPVLTWATVAVFIGMAIWIGNREAGAGTAFGGSFIDDAFARFAKVTVLLAAAAVLAMSEDYMRRRGLARFEYPILITFAVIGMMMMVSAGDLMALYMGLELQSLSLYVVASLRRDSAISTEAGLKYFVLGALSSGLLQAILGAFILVLTWMPRLGRMGAIGIVLGWRASQAGKSGSSSEPDYRQVPSSASERMFLSM